jgi:hypothetical protein
MIVLVICKISRRIKSIPSDDHFLSVPAQDNVSGVRNRQDRVGTSVCSRVFQPYPKGITQEPIGRKSGRWKQYSRRIFHVQEPRDIPCIPGTGNIRNLTVSARIITESS